MKKPKTYKELIEKGAIILNETKSTITLQLPREFSLLAFILWTLFFSLVGAVGYMIYDSVKEGEKKTFNK